MKQTAIIIVMACFFSSCSFFKSDETKAIELVQQTNIGGIINSTWLDQANQEAKDQPNTKFKWIATKAPEAGIFLVSFEDEKTWGRKWEVTLKEKIVKLINDNDYLSMKYGYSRFDGDANFTISNISVDTLKVEAAQVYQGFWESMFSSPKYKSEIVYRFEADVTNNTDKFITRAKLDGTLKLIFKEKTIEGSSGTYTLKPSVSQENPWAPGETKSIVIRTKNIEKIYLNYKPEYTVFQIELKAEDPIGFTYSKNILEADKSTDWKYFTERMLSKPIPDGNNVTTTHVVKTSTSSEPEKEVEENNDAGENSDNNSSNQ